MTELRGEDRALLELAQEVDAPTDRDRARVRAALASRLGAAAGLTAAAGLASGVTQAAAASGVTAGTAVTSTGAGSAAAGAAAGGMTAGGVTAAGGLGAAMAVSKLAGAVLVLSMTVGVGAAVVRHQRHAHVALVTASESTARPGHVTAGGGGAAPLVVRRPANLPAETEPDPPSLPLEARPPVSHRAAPDSRAPAKSVVDAPGRKEVAPAARRSMTAVADEAGLVHAGVTALRSGQPAQALELFERHARLYPQGVLAEERDAERAVALADLGRAADARAAIREFLRLHPRSPLAARLRERQLTLDDDGP